MKNMGVHLAQGFLLGRPDRMDARSASESGDSGDRRPRRGAKRPKAGQLRRVTITLLGRGVPTVEPLTGCTGQAHDAQTALWRRRPFQNSETATKLPPTGATTASGRSSNEPATAVPHTRNPKAARPQTTHRPCDRHETARLAKAHHNR